MSHSQQDIDVFIRTVFGEAEAWNRDDATAIAHVIINRLRHQRWGKTLKAVCQAKWQFSCWNKGDPNRERIVTAKRGVGWIATVEKICMDCLGGFIPDPTGGATHYYATFVKEPLWAKHKQPVYRVAHKRNHAHLYFNDIDTPKPLMKSNTMMGAGGASIAVGGALIDVLAEHIPAARAVIEPLAEQFPWAQYVTVALGVIGVIMVVYARLRLRKREGI